jgi:hypothetical protein
MIPSASANHIHLRFVYSVLSAALVSRLASAGLHQHWGGNNVAKAGWLDDDSLFMYR